MKNKVTNRFFIKLMLYLNLKKFEVNTENTRSSIDDRGSERVKCYLPRAICAFTCYAIGGLIFIAKVKKFLLCL